MTEKCTDVEIDLESLSLAPNAAITQVGAVAYNMFVTPFTVVEEFNAYISLEKMHTGHHLDPVTLQWRLQHGHAETLRSAQRSEHHVLLALTEWLEELTLPTTRLWSRGGIDFTWLESAFKLHGMKTPWKYNQLRDSRTYSDSSLHPGVEIAAVAPVGTSHDALDDAEFQARGVHATYWAQASPPLRAFHPMLDHP